MIFQEKPTLMAREKYDHEFKIAAAKLVCDQVYTIKKAAESLGVSQGFIRSRAFSHAPALSPRATGP